MKLNKYSVLQIGKFFYPEQGGIETVTKLIVQELQKKYSSDVLCFSKDGKSAKKIFETSNIYQCGHFGIIASMPVSLSFFWQFLKLRNCYDILHIHVPNPLAAIALWLFRSKAKIIVHWHGDILNKGFLYNWFRFFEMRMLQRADIVLATTEIYAKHSPALIAFEKKIKVISLGIDEEQLKSDPCEIVEIKKRFTGKKIVFSLGRFVYFKGFEYLINAAKHVSDDVILILGGAGRLEEKYKKKIEEESLTNKVFIVLNNEKLSWGSYYSVCDVFCLPSIERSESFGLVLLEAMSFSKPCITTTVKGSGTSWVNADGITGYNVPPKDSVSLAMAIERIIKSSEYDTICKSSRQRFETHFRHTTMLKEILQTYHDILT